MGIFVQMLSIFVLFTEILCAHEIILQVEDGVLDGEILATTTGKGNYYSFKGIPYAEPPLGSLRFKGPRPPLKWKGVKQAKKHGPVCIQPATITNENTIIGSENCLFLNVYTPSLNPVIPLPVMVFIHGGIFATGSGNSNFYSPDFLVEHGVILVTFNYRLGALGFLALDTPDVPGNAGLNDQIAALEWVKKNIKYFGGNPDNVTIFGQAAGSTSVTYHLVSPLAKGLFKRAIAMSGVVFNDFGIGLAHKKRAFNLGRRLGCYTNETDDLVKFLRSMPAEDIVRVRSDVLFSDKVSGRLVNTAYFSPIVEKKVGGKQYLTEQPGGLLRKRLFNDVDLLIGHTDKEGLYNTITFQDLTLDSYPKNKELFVPAKLAYKNSAECVLKLADIIESYYFGNYTVTLTNMDSYVRFNTFAHYIYDITIFIDKYLPKNTTGKHYMYNFTVYTERNVHAKPAAEKFGIYGAAHRDDLPYLFDGQAFNLRLNLQSESYRHIERITKLYTNFAKYGNPTPDNSFGLIWPEYDNRRSFVEISDELSIRQLQYTGDLEFWSKIYNSECGVEHYVEQ